MALVILDEAINGLNGALRFFRRRVSILRNISATDIDTVYMFIIEVGIYLYAKYHVCGEKVKNGYKIFGETLRNIYAEYDADLAKVALAITNVRNVAVHVAYTEDADEKVKDMLIDEQFIRLLRCEGIIDRNLNFIEPSNGKYKYVLSQEEALAGIKFMVDKINAEDTEEENKNKSDINSILSKAISTMSGD